MDTIVLPCPPQLDRALYKSCREDREALCPDTPDDSGAVYDCLYRVKFDRRLSGKCRKEVCILGRVYIYIIGCHV